MEGVEKWGSTYGDRGARAYNGGLGRSRLRGPGAKPLVRGSGGKAPEAESLLAFIRPAKAPNFAESVNDNYL